MKYILTALILVNVAWAAEKPKAQPKKPTAQLNTGSKGKEILKEKEDCDDKAKKKVEIKPETISLGGGNAGCSLDDM